MSCLMLGTKVIVQLSFLSKNIYLDTYEPRNILLKRKLVGISLGVDTL